MISKSDMIYLQQFIGIDIVDSNGNVIDRVSTMQQPKKSIISQYYEYPHGALRFNEDTLTYTYEEKARRSYLSFGLITIAIIGLIATYTHFV